jgi:hypothetical protein
VSEIDNSVTVGGEPVGGSRDVAISTWNLNELDSRVYTSAIRVAFEGRDS